MDFFTGPFVQHIQNPQNKFAQFLYTQTNNHLVLFPPYQGDVVMETLDKIRDSNSGLDNILKSLPHAHRAVIAVLFAAMSNTNPDIVDVGLFPTTDNYVASVIKSMIARDVVSTTRVLGIRAIEALNTRQCDTHHNGHADTPTENGHPRGPPTAAIAARIPEIEHMIEAVQCPARRHVLMYTCMYGNSWLDTPMEERR